jgi:hypothetical protein
MRVESKWSLSKTMLVPVGIALAFLVWGLMVYYTVGDKPFNEWHFGIISDVPGQSPHSTEVIGRLPRPQPERIGKGILRQHVDSNPNEPPEKIKMKDE